MNSTFQHDSHPDAESLNAFAEQALPERERGTVLAHLAACSRCRQVVFLAQEAASEFEMQVAAASSLEMDPAEAYGFAAALAAAPAPMAAVGSASSGRAQKRRGWWAGHWRIAWIPAAALAATVGLVVYIHIRPGSESGAKLALNAPPAAPQQLEKPPAPVPADKAALAKPAPPNAGKASNQKTFAAAASAPSKAFSAPAAAGATEPSSTALNPAEPQPQAQGQGAGMRNAALFPQPAPAAAPRPMPAVGASSFHGSASTTAQSADTQAQSIRSVSAGAFVSQPTIKSAPAGRFAASSQQLPELKAEARAFRIQPASPLPSGLRAVSTVTAQHRMLAIDIAGALFLSNDSAGHWEPVPRQWSGHAVAVRIQRANEPAADLHAEAIAANVEDEVGSNPSAATAPAAIFEIVNDNDRVWVSTDGRTWKAK